MMHRAIRRRCAGMCMLDAPAQAERPEYDDARVHGKRRHAECEEHLTNVPHRDQDGSYTHAMGCREMSVC